jgi:hypothetical protein
MGGSWPSGTFSSINSASTNSGFALRGFAFNLDATYPLNDHWGLKGMVMLNNNPVDRQGIGTLMENRMKKIVSFAESERDNLTLTVNSWMSNSMVFGPVFSVNFDRLSWDFMVMAGLNVAYLPNQKLLFKNPTANWEYLQHNTKMVDFSPDFLAGTALRMKVTEKVQLKLALDYQSSGSKSPYEEVKTTKLNSSTTTEHLGSGSTFVRKEVIIGSLGFVYYL